ncbi:DUF2384 domain-containing protein [Pseudomonas sp. 3A(2025)]
MLLDSPRTASAAEDFWQRLNLSPRGVQLHNALREGLPYAVFDHLADAIAINRSTLADYLAIAPATLQRRLKARRFNVEESDRLFRLASIYAAALELFEGNIETVRRWLVHPVSGLDQRCPLDMLITSAESQAVLDLMGRLEHGVMV